MTGFTRQTIRLSAGEFEVDAQTTTCPYLVITPGISMRDGRPRFADGLGLTHTLTGLRIGTAAPTSRLEVLAESYAGVDWNFTDTEHFKQPENAAKLKTVQEIYREWEAADAYQGPAHFSDDSDEVKAARASDPAGTFLREHIQWWIGHSKALWSRDSDTGIPSWDENPKARYAELNVSCQAYGLIYLLAVLRAIDPKVADTAARDLVISLEAGDSLGEWVWQWNDELAAGKPLTLHGIPTFGPLAVFGGPGGSDQ